jgi:hypothetical protein
MDQVKNMYLEINKLNVIIVIELKKYKQIVNVKKYFIVQKNVIQKINLIIKMFVNLIKMLEVKIK